MSHKLSKQNMLKYMLHFVQRPSTHINCYKTATVTVYLLPLWQVEICHLSIIQQFSESFRSVMMPVTRMHWEIAIIMKGRSFTRIAIIGLIMEELLTEMRLSA